MVKSDWQHREACNANLTKNNFLVLANCNKKNNTNTLDSEGKIEELMVVKGFEFNKNFLYSNSRKNQNSMQDVLIGTTEATCDQLKMNKEVEERDHL